jgi:hypothetical protein
MRTPSGDAIYYVIERGTHEELMAADGLYANLCRVQSTAVTIEERLDELEERLNAQRPTFNAQRVTSQGREDERPAVSARGYRRKEGEWGSGKLRREQPEDDRDPSTSPAILRDPVG